MIQNQSLEPTSVRQAAASGSASTLDITEKTVKWRLLGPWGVTHWLAT